MKKRAVFLDRDGTLNEDVGYPSAFSQIRIFPAAFEAVRKIRSAGFLAVVVTNQSAVGRGLLSEDELKNIQESIQASFAAEGAELDAFYYCPHYEQAALPIYRKSCDCRKPAPGLAVRAAADLDLDLSASYMIGDKIEDIEFALNAGTTPVLVLTGCGRESRLKLEEKGLRPAFVAEDILSAANWILRRERNIQETGAG
jgi:D-glycero-D-manno-heptose 1,7-bisphosphate phosphatase